MAANELSNRLGVVWPVINKCFHGVVEAEPCEKCAIEAAKPPRPKVPYGHRNYFQACHPIGESGRYGQYGKWVSLAECAHGQPIPVDAYSGRFEKYKCVECDAQRAEHKAQEVAVKALMKDFKRIPIPKRLKAAYAAAAERFHNGEIEDFRIINGELIIVPKAQQQMEMAA